ncbi:MAG TPA: hypothetical protein VM367_00385 [Pseudonocardia sp.]|nr:hypothetical protein [Pseudonocardia sp.]
MSLSNVWVQTQADGLIRADQVVGIEAHRTPTLSGKPSRWLLDVVLPASTGSGSREGWSVSVLHRTLIQTGEDPGEAPHMLARLLTQLDLVSATGVIVTTREERTTADGAVEPGAVRFRFVAFTDPAPGHHTGPEYL